MPFPSRGPRPTCSSQVRRRTCLGFGGFSLQEKIILSRFLLGGYPDGNHNYELRKTEIDHELECQVVRDVPPLPPLHQASLSGFL